MLAIRKDVLFFAFALLFTLSCLEPSSMTMAGHTTDFEATRRQALHDNATAQNTLGSMYAKGQGVSQDYSAALLWYKKAAEQGNADAQFNLGSMYHKGDGVSQDYTQAIDWYSKAVEKGNKSAMAELENVKNDISSLKKLAEQGKNESMVKLADMYTAGNGVPRDDEQAVVLYRKAAKLGSAAAQCKLGIMYSEGKGVAQDFSQSITWYRLAIDQDYAPAKYSLASMYFKGKGVAKDNVQAYAWLSLAAAQGDGNAAMNKEFAASMLTQEQLAEAQALATQFQSKIDSLQKKP